MLRFIKRLIILSIIVAIGALGYFAWNKIKDSTTSTVNQVQSAVDKALEEAKNFVPPSGLECAQHITKAINIDTGVSYDFPSSCLPSGWKLANN